MCKETAAEAEAEKSRREGPVDEKEKGPREGRVDWEDSTEPQVAGRDLCCRAKPKEAKDGNDLGVWESSLEDRSGVVNVWLLGYLTPLLRLGSTKVLDQKDIGVPSKEDLATNAYDSSKAAWDEQMIKNKATNEKLKAAYEEKLAKCKNERQRSRVKAPKYKEPSIALALLKAFGVSKVIVATFYYICSTLLAFVPVIILNDLVKFFESGESINEYDGYAHPWLEVVALGVVPFLISLLQTRNQTIMAHCAVFVRTAVSTMLYRKALRVSGAGRAMTSTGQVVNMMSNDTAQLQRFLQFGGMTLTAPISIIIALILIYQQVRYQHSHEYQCLRRGIYIYISSHLFYPSPFKYYRLETQPGWELDTWSFLCRSICLSFRLFPSSVEWCSSTRICESK
jgi:hypothetical protein